jgi:hypothetical protein
MRRCMHLQNEPASLQGYLAHKQHPPPRTLQQDYLGSYGGPKGGGAVSYERVTPVASVLLSIQILRRPLSLKLSDTKVYEPSERARLGTGEPRS